MSLYRVSQKNFPLEFKCFLAVLAVKNTGRSGCQKHILLLSWGASQGVQPVTRAFVNLLVTMVAVIFIDDDDDDDDSDE